MPVNAATRQRHRSSRALTALTLAGFALAGCTAPAGGTSPSPTPTAEPSAPSATPSATPTPEPTPDAADPSTWVISEDGVGPFLLGQPREALVAGSPRFTPWNTNCANPDVVDLADPAGPADPYPASSIRLVFDAQNSLETAQVNGLDAFAGVETAEGVGVGSALQAVQDAYPDLEEWRQGADIAYFTVEGDPGWITFRPADGSDDPAAVIEQVIVVAGARPPSEYCG